MRYFSVLISLCVAAQLFGQEPEPYRFTSVKDLPATQVKDQGKTGTCWAFSGTSLIESELIRLGKNDTDISEMYVVRCIYAEKATNYIRRQGHTRFSEGGLAHDVFNVVNKYGLLPQKAYPGKQNDGPYDHSKIEVELKKICDDVIASGKSGTLPTDWLQRIDNYLNAQFGAVPASFMHEGKTYVPQSFRDALGIRATEFVTLTSFSHHPFFSSFILEIPDNFSNGSYYNVPLNDLIRCINYSVQSGYSVSWDADVSNKGFGPKHGLAIVPAVDWSKKSDVQKTNTFKYREPELQVSQDLRQQQFDIQETQDDHLMHITGIMNEPDAGIFYKVKNSWGEISDLKGYFYASEAYVRMNTIGITLNKEAIPVDLRRRLGLEEGMVAIEKGQRAPTPMPARPAEAPKPAVKENRIKE